MKKSWTKNSHRILEQATDLDNYNRWIISLFKKYFGKYILEVGSGLGGLSLHLPKTKVTLSDTRDDYLSHLKKLFNYKILKLDIEKEAPTNLVNTYDTVFSSNVLEHIKDDESAMKNCFKVLRKKGKLLLFVPARKEIFGNLDRAMGHYRRYTKEELIRKVEKIGFKILKIKYVNFPGYFSWWLRGKSPIKSNSDNLMAKVFDTLVVPFLYPEKYLPIPFGQSLMLVAEKP
jgi:2-polyprenyl-3-methyl-5-hydroxy-6-metoxy-1,4-benzoquinol methylase